MVHDSQRLPLELEAPQHGLAVHSKLDDLERDTPAHGFALLGQVDRAHAALAEHVEDPVRADLLRTLSGGAVSGRDQVGWHGGRR